MSGAPRGEAAVGRLADLAPVEAGAVMYLRMWSDSAHSRADAASDFDLALGRGSGQAATTTLDQICALYASHGRRPLIRHELGCSCLGADESCFAQMIGAAADGQHEDAMMMAALIVRPDFAPSLAALSQQFGLALRRMTLPFQHGRVTHSPTPSVLH